MKIISWDVGIINLAFCIIDIESITDTKKKWSIHDWGVINLTNRESLKCYNCGKNASCFLEKDDIYCIPTNNNDLYYCKKHLPKDIKKPNFEEIVNVLDTVSNQIFPNCEWDGKECIKKSKYSIRGKCFCNAHAKSVFKKIEGRYDIQNLKRKSVGSIDIEDLKIQLIKKLESRTDFLENSYVVIENQPSMKNPKMKAIASTIYDYFLIRGLFDKEKNDSQIVKVKFMSPSNKLKLADDKDTSTLVKLKGDEAKSYKLTKSLSVKYTNKILEKDNIDNKWNNFFQDSKKKDDLADCLLQGLYFMNSID